MEQLDSAMEVADLIWSDSALQSKLTQFCKDYIAAQHLTEQAEMLGGAVFEILLTIILAAVTGGVGAVASLGSKTRLLSKFRKVGDLLMEFAEASKKAKNANKSKGVKANKGKSASFSDFEDGGEVEVKPLTRTPNSKQIKKEKSGGAETKGSETSKEANNNDENTSGLKNKQTSPVVPSEVDWDSSGPNGFEVKDPRDFDVGLEMFDRLVDQGLEPVLALRISRELLESGVEEPTKLTVNKGDSLYKIVPKDSGPPSDVSPYYMTEDMLESLPDNAKTAGDILGLPQVPESFDVYKMTATSDAAVYQSEIAPFSVNDGSFIRSGGGTQTLVIDKSSFATPTKI